MPKHKPNARRRSKDTTTGDLLSWRVDDRVVPMALPTGPTLPVVERSPTPQDHDENEVEAIYNYVRNDRSCYESLEDIVGMAARSSSVGIYDHDRVVKEVVRRVIDPCRRKYRREFPGEEAVTGGAFSAATRTFAAEMLVDDIEINLGINREASRGVRDAKTNGLQADTEREQAVIDRHMGAVVEATYPDGSVVAIGRVTGGSVKRTPVHRSERPSGGYDDGSRRRRSSVVPGPPQAVLVVESSMTGRPVSFGTHGVNLRVLQPANSPARIAAPTPPSSPYYPGGQGTRQTGWKFNGSARERAETERQARIFRNAVALNRVVRYMNVPAYRGVLTAHLDGEHVVFSGGERGEHRLDILSSGPDRVVAHWYGYVESNRATVPSGQRETLDREVRAYQIAAQKAASAGKPEGTYQDFHGVRVMAVWRATVTDRDSRATRDVVRIRFATGLPEAAKAELKRAGFAFAMSSWGGQSTWEARSHNHAATALARSIDHTY